MASQQVISALESLQKELERLEPAVKHVETAVEVTKIVKEIPQKHLELLKELRNDEEKFKKELKDNFTKDLSQITEENRKLQKATSDIQDQVKKEQESIKVLLEKIQNFHEKIEKIQFPERLDKLDANVAGIMAAVQSIQSRLDTVERNLSDRLKEIKYEVENAYVDILETLKKSVSDLSAQQLESQKMIKEAINSTAKTNKIMIIIAWVLIILSSSVFIFLNLK